MTDNLPAVRPETAVVTADTDSWINVMGDVVRLAAHIADTEFVPRALRGKPAACSAALLYGREVGLPPMTALTQTHVIEGKPGLAAEAMRALVYAAGHEIEFVESTMAFCRIRGRRRGQESWTEVLWTMQMAQQAGLLAKDNWKKYPRTQLQARCTTELCRMIFPDVIHGFRSIEELEDMGAGEGPAEALTTGATGSSTVKRTGKTAAKKASPAAALGTGPAQRRAPSTVPLPGEEGFDDLTTQNADTSRASTAGLGDRDVSAPDGPEGETSTPDPSGPQDGDSEGSQEETSGAEGEAGSIPAGTPSESSSVVDEHGQEAIDVEVVEGKPEPAPPRKASRAQLAMYRARFKDLGVPQGESGRETRLSLTGRIVNRRVDSSTDLTAGEMSALLDTLARVRGLSELEALLDAQEQQ